MNADQQAFVDALLGRGDAPAALTAPGGSGTRDDPDARGSHLRGWAAYRNNLQALSAQALAVPFARLRAELGEDDFASLAWTFWRHHPPMCGDLGEWGGALEGFLIERAGEASGLPDLARLDWALHEAERAVDAELDAASLHLLGTTPPDQLWLQLRPSVTVLAQREGPVIVWRQGWRGEFQPVCTAEAAFLRAVLGGANLADALDHGEVKGSGGEADFDFSAWLQAALKNAWLQRVTATPHNQPLTP